MDKSSNKYAQDAMNIDQYVEAANHDGESNTQWRFLAYKVVKQIAFTGLWISMVIIHFIE